MKDVLPTDLPGGSLLKVQSSSKLAFGATTAALVTLASGGTAVVVTQATSSMSVAPAAPAPVARPDVVVEPPAPDLVVERPVGVTREQAEATARALREALARQRTARTVVAPLVRLDPDPVEVPAQVEVGGGAQELPPLDLDGLTPPSDPATPVGPPFVPEQPAPPVVQVPPVVEVPPVAPPVVEPVVEVPKPHGKPDKDPTPPEPVPVVAGPTVLPLTRAEQRAVLKAERAAAKDDRNGDKPAKGKHAKS